MKRKNHFVKYRTDLIYDFKKALTDWDPVHHKLLGVAVNSKNDLFIVSPTYHGGSIIKLKKRFLKYRHQILVENTGYINDIVFDEKKNRIFTTAQKERQIQKYELNTITYGKTLNFEESKHLLTSTNGMPNGLALIGDSKIVYNSSSLATSYVTSYDLARGIEWTVFEKDGAWFDGLYYEATSNILFVSDNKNGEIEVFKNYSHNRTLKLRGLNTEQRFGPAEITYIDGKIYIADLWRPSTIDLVTFELLDMAEEVFEVNKNEAYRFNSLVLKIEFDLETVMNPSDLFPNFKGSYLKH